MANYHFQGTNFKFGQPKIKSGTFSAKFPNNCKFNLNFNTLSIKILNGLAQVGHMHCWPTCIAHKLTISILTFCQNVQLHTQLYCQSLLFTAALSAAETHKDSPTSGPLNSRLSMLCMRRDAEKRNFYRPKSPIIQRRHSFQNATL